MRVFRRSRCAFPIHSSGWRRRRTRFHRQPRIYLPPIGNGPFARSHFRLRHRAQDQWRRLPEAAGEAALTNQTRCGYHGRVIYHGLVKYHGHDHGFGPCERVEMALTIRGTSSIEFARGSDQRHDSKGVIFRKGAKPDGADISLSGKLPAIGQRHPRFRQCSLARPTVRPFRRTAADR